MEPRPQDNYDGVLDALVSRRQPVPLPLCLIKI